MTRPDAPTDERLSDLSRQLTVVVASIEEVNKRKEAALATVRSCDTLLSQENARRLALLDEIRETALEE